jgi:hypothetical protein
MKSELETLAKSLESRGLIHHASTIRSLAIADRYEDSHYQQKQKEIAKDDAYNAAHIVLDVLGFIPGYGEIADLSNAALYLSKGSTPENLLNAAFSLISCIPEFGDIIAKVVKYGRKISAEILKTATELIIEYQSEIKAIFMKLKNANIASHLSKIPGGSALPLNADKLWPAVERWLEGVMAENMKEFLLLYDV